MKTLITLFTVSVFIIILIKSKLGKLGIKTTKNKKPAALEAETQTQAPSSADNGLLDGYYRHDAYVFDYDKCDSETYFAGLIEAKISFIESQMREQGRTYRFKYLILNNAIVLIVEYRMKTAPVSLPEVKA
ncbi:MAG: hypothetical protein NC433_02970 [Clostridiales bacterium]|nr:hypothetical protein [Clostridiales bacterium]